MANIIRLADTGLETAVSLTVKILNEGGIVAVPTDTLYGLVSTIDNFHKLYAVKRRNRLKPCGIFIADVRDVKKWCLTCVEDSILQRLLPGPVTLLFQRSHTLPHDFNPGCSSVGIRIPRNEFVCKVAAAVSNQPLVQTSANVSECISPGCIEGFRNLWGEIDLVVDGGVILDCSGNISRTGSTIVNLSTPGTYSIIRDGSARVITEDILRDCGLVATTDGDFTN